MGELGKFLTPHLARSLPELATAVPYLFAVDMIQLVLTSIAAVRFTRYVVRLTPDAKKNEQNDVAHHLRSAERLAGRALYTLLAFAIVVMIVWLTLFVTGQASPALTELVLIVIYPGMVAPMYVVARVLRGAIGIAARKLSV